jgi:hypothetical protein
VAYRRVLDWIIGFIDILYTPLGTKDNYSANADLHTLDFTAYNHYASQPSLVVSLQRVFNNITVTSNHT